VSRGRRLFAPTIVALSALVACSDDEPATTGTTLPTSATTELPSTTSTTATTQTTTPPRTTPETDDSAPSSARDVVDAFVEDVWIGGSTAVAAELVAPDVDRLPAADGIDALIADLAANPVTGVEVHTVIGDDERVAVLFTRNDAAAPNGRFEGLDVYTVTDGLITGIIQLTSTANVATDPAALPPTSTRAPQPADPATIDANLALLTKFFAELFGNGDPTAADRYVAEGYLQHNPSVAPGREGLKALVTATGPTPLTGLGSLGTIAEGDFVVNLSELPVAEDFLLVDVFRVEDGLLAEHWDFTPLGTTLPAPPG
jgi:predicted SnoaL-like aldol condensation-catalyzing enzyme